MQRGSQLLKPFIYKGLTKLTNWSGEFKAPIVCKRTTIEALTIMVFKKMDSGAPHRYALQSLNGKQTLYIIRGFQLLLVSCWNHTTAL